RQRAGARHRALARRGARRHDPRGGGAWRRGPLLVHAARRRSNAPGLPCLAAASGDVPDLVTAFADGGGPPEDVRHLLGPCHIQTGVLDMSPEYYDRERAASLRTDEGEAGCSP